MKYNKKNIYLIIENELTIAAQIIKLKCLPYSNSYPTTASFRIERSIS